MNLDEYVESVRHGVHNAAALADDHSREVATKLGAALESATRLSLIQALSDAASEISADLAPGSVELRMSGGEPQFVVTTPLSSRDQPTVLLPEPETAAQSEPGEEEPQSRITLRLPQSVKDKVDQLADVEGVSTNAWLIRAVMDALANSRGRGPWPVRQRGPRWAGPPAGSAVPPFPPDPAQGPLDPNSPGGPRSGRRHQEGPGFGSVKGWVR